MKTRHNLTRTSRKIWTTCAALAVSSAVHATDFNNSYIGANNGLWNVPTNWSPNMVPMNGGGDTYNVIITVDLLV